MEKAVRGKVRAFIEQLLEVELDAALGRERYQRGASTNGRRHGHRPRQAGHQLRPAEPVGAGAAGDATGERQWRSALLPAYQRRSHRAEALMSISPE